MKSICNFGPALVVPKLLNLAEHTLSFASTQPNKTALTLVSSVDDASAIQLTYADLWQCVSTAAGGLRDLGIAKGDRVVLRIGHSIDFPIFFLAATAIGAVVVPTSTTLSEVEVLFITEQTDASLVVCSREFMLTDLKCPILDAAIIKGDPIETFAETNAVELAYIIYTSGSSGTPKGVAHAHRAAFARRMMWDGWYGLTRSDTVLHAGAFNWTYTLGAGLMDPWAAGASALIYTGPKDPSIWPQLIKQYGATLFAATPGVYRQLLKYNSDLPEMPSLRHGLSAGEAMPDQVMNEWIERTRKPIFGALGMTECSTFLSSSPTSEPKNGFAGRVQPGRKIAILSLKDDDPVKMETVGEIAIHVSDPGLMLGYWERPDETQKAMTSGWFRTGDLGLMVSDGYVRYEGRADDQMNAQGYRVAPQEVENALLKHPRVSNAAAVELPVRADLALIAAFYTSDEGQQCEHELQSHCSQHLAGYKIPKIFKHVEDLPRSPNGKILRKTLVSEYGHQRAL